jgi:hypothetical protein
MRDFARRFDKRGLARRFSSLQASEGLQELIAPHGVPTPDSLPLGDFRQFFRRMGFEGGCGYQGYHLGRLLPGGSAQTLSEVGGSSVVHDRPKRSLPTRQSLAE